MLATLDGHDLDDGPRITKSGTARMCAVTRRVRPIDELIRFVLDGEGRVVPDVKRKLPGRGLWISASRNAVATAVKRAVFAKGFRKQVKDRDTLVAETERLLVASAIEALAIAAKAGEVVSGFAKVESCLRAGEVKALIHAQDGAADGIRKLDGLAAAASGGRDPETAPKTPILNELTSAELDLALGRANVIHAALLAGPAGKTFLSRIERLVRFRTSDGDETANKNSGTTSRASAPKD
jgi:predicted RNA-binding protein YlxR (DUF448 family)